MYHQGMELQILLHDTCFQCGIASPMFISVEFYTPEGMDYAPTMLALEEKFLMYWLNENLVHDENYSSYLISFLRTRNILEGRTVTF